MEARNFLFIMLDQWRWDHLSCAGHPFLKTPSFDALARRGVRFTNAYVQSAVCVPSRMSFYTGRYMSNHGATWNRVPLSAAETTLGELLHEAGIDFALSGKTHVFPDLRGLQRLGQRSHRSAPGDDMTPLGKLIASGGFSEIDRYDGHGGAEKSAYATWLRAKGYASTEPWSDFEASANDTLGRKVSGWQMRNARYPARVAEEHSETAYTTDRALDYLRAKGDSPWAMHLSYIKPHWPYLAPAPYHALYGEETILPPVRHAGELNDAHPVVAAYRSTHDACINFARDDVWRTVRPAYQGLVTQVDQHLGRIWRFLEATGRWKDTLVVLTSDHGDFLGDHWLGDKELLYDTVVRVPMIVFDPHSAADATRGTVDERLVEAIDVAPTALESLGLTVPWHKMEGRSLLALTRGGVTTWRDAVFSELDYGMRAARRTLGRDPSACRAWMVRTHHWKYVEWQDFPPQLFDLVNDPDELNDRGQDPALDPLRRELRARLWEWHSRLKRRTTFTDSEVETVTTESQSAGFGRW